MARSRWNVSALCFVMAVGCNEVAGIKEPVSDEAGTTPTPTPTPTSTATPGDTGVDRFYGNWTSSNGKLVLSNCQFAKTLTAQSTGIAFEKGTAAGTVVARLDVNCALKTTVAGDALSLAPGQQCTAQGNTAEQKPTLTFYYATSTFTLAAGSSTQAAEHLTASVEFSNAGSGVVVDTCDYEETATFSKVP